MGDFAGLRAFATSFERQGSGDSVPGDELFPQYQIVPQRLCERQFLTLHNPDITDDEMRAFTVANKIEDALGRHDNPTARKMAFTAMRLDPRCVDAYIGVLLYMNELTDPDTIITGYRELLYAIRDFYADGWEDRELDFYKMSFRRPYIRALCNLAGASRRDDDLIEITTFAYEELLRLNFGDNTGARTPLVSCYLKLIGRRKRLPRTVPVRTIAQLRGMVRPLNQGGIFADDACEPMKRWAKIVIAWETGRNWKDLARREYETAEPIFRVVFGEVDPQSLPHDDSLPGYRMCDPMDDARYYGVFIAEGLADWPDFLIALHDLFRKPDAKFSRKVRADAPDPRPHRTKLAQKELRARAQKSLQEGRQALTADRFQEAMVAFMAAKYAWGLINFESGRWYLGAEFAIASNLATCAAALGHWGFVRMNARLTLLMKPDHLRTYEKMPRIKEAHFCPQMTSRVGDLLAEVHSDEVKNADDWRRVAQVGIALLSLKAIIAARTGELTEELVEEMIAIGIEDMYTPVNVAADVYPVLPWLTVTDLEGDAADDAVD
jgi:hypothetical protein